MQSLAMLVIATLALILTIEAAPVVDANTPLKTKRQAWATVTNNTPQTWYNVSLVHKYSTVYVNRGERSTIAAGESIREILRADYHTGATPGADWWRLEFYNQDSSVMYFSDPKNFAGLVDTANYVATPLIVGAATAVPPDKYTGAASRLFSSARRIILKKRFLQHLGKGASKLFSWVSGKIWKPAAQATRAGDDAGRVVANQAGHAGDEAGTIAAQATRAETEAAEVAGGQAGKTKSSKPDTDRGGMPDVASDPEDSGADTSRTPAAKAGGTTGGSSKSWLVNTGVMTGVFVGSKAASESVFDSSEKIKGFKQHTLTAADADEEVDFIINANSTLTIISKSLFANDIPISSSSTPRSRPKAHDKQFVPFQNTTINARRLRYR